jgi:hypothetical protein
MHPQVVIGQLCWVKRTWSRDQLQSQTEQAGPTARALGRQPIGSNMGSASFSTNKMFIIKKFLIMQWEL